MLSPAQQAVAARSHIDLRLAETGVSTDEVLRGRLDRHVARLFTHVTDVDGERADCLDQLARLLVVVARAAAERRDDLRSVDAVREDHPDWFLGNRWLQL